MNRLNLFPSRASSVTRIGRVHWLGIIVFLFALQEAATSCGGPVITVENNTKFPVRVVVTNGGSSQTLSPSPGESSAADATEGTYTASVVPDKEWINYAKDVRAFLNNQLAHSDQLTGPQLLDVVQRLKNIAAQMAAYEQAGKGAGCSGNTVSADHDGLVQVSVGSDGTLVAQCK
ncbi:MAG: hypothetical protein WCF84_16510 [Anaerolineae bacterium]